MTTSSLFTWILLIAGMASFLLTTLGMLLVRDVYQRIQYAYPAATVGFVAVVAAILIHKSISQAGIKTLLTGLIVFWTNPVISHATARAARVRKLGHWLPGDKENIQAAGDDE